MKKETTISLVLGLFVQLPIWFYLVWWLLTHIGAGDLQMFLFWVYVPVSFMIRILATIASRSNA